MHRSFRLVACLFVLSCLSTCSSETTKQDASSSDTSSSDTGADVGDDADEPEERGWCQQRCDNDDDCKKIDKSECNNGVCAQCARDLTCDGLGYTGGCDKQRGLCLQCRTDDQCPEGETCFKEMGVCKQCDGDDDCVEDTNLIGSGSCDPLWKMCIGCVDDNSCKAVADYGVGSLCRESRCVFCKTDADCDGSGSGKCEPSWGECNGCSRDTDCASLGEGYECLPVAALSMK